MRESKLAEELQKGEKGYGHIKRMLEYLDDLESIFVLLGRDHKVAYINGAGCELLGAEYDRVVGKNWFENFLPKAESRDVGLVFEELMAGEVEAFSTHANRIRTTSGHEVLVRWDNSLIKSNKGKSIVGSFSLGKKIGPSDGIDELVSICSYCKNIRNSDDQWEPVEKYFSENHNVAFSHGLCSKCLTKELHKLE